MPRGRTSRLVAGLLFALAAAFIGGCSDDDDKILGSVETEGDLNTWIWALDDETGTIWVHEADTGELKATLAGQCHPMMRQVLAGPDAEPTVWMGKSGAAHAFTRGFHPHGDHTHMEVPEARGTVATGPGNVHQSVDEHGDYVCYANDGDSTFTLIDVATRTARTAHHGSGHSLAFYSHDILAATDMHGERARIIDANADTVIHEVAIDTLAHGHAFHHDSETLFIATLNGFEVLDLESGTLASMISYPAAGRVNFLYHSGDVPVAFGPHRTEGATDAIILLDMAARTAEALTIEGASLAWNISAGNFALSEDGRMIVATDLARPQAYVICIDAANASCYRTVISVTVPAAGMACAINHSGDHIWLLNKTTGTVSCYHPDEDELHNSWAVDVGADYIFATSLPSGSEVIKDY